MRARVLGLMLGGYSLEVQFSCQPQNENWRFFNNKIGTQDLLDMNYFSYHLGTTSNVYMHNITFLI